MKSTTRPFRGWLLPVVLTGSVLCLVAWLPPATVLYYAGFNEIPPPSQQQTFPATGGNAAIQGPQDVFYVEINPATGDGDLVVESNANGIPATLDCNLQDPFTGDECTITFSLERLDTFGDLVFKVDDDDDTGVIDLEFDDEGNVRVRVGGIPVNVPLAPGMLDDVLAVRLTLRDPFFGPESWMLSIDAAGQTVQASGDLLVNGGLRVGAMQLVRPAFTLTGLDRFDDLRLTEPDGSFASGSSFIRK